MSHTTSTDVTPPPVQEAWRSGAKDLARWTWDHLVNRTDVWGGYLPVDRRRQKTRADGTVYFEKSITKPRITKRGQTKLTVKVLERHYAGRNEGDVAGLHTTSPENTSRWFLIEDDKHDGDAEADAEANLKAILFLHDKLVSLGFNPLLSDSNGDGGYHLLTLLDAPLPTPRVYAFAQDLVADHGALGLAHRPETFPKQPELCGNVEFGNWARLPGRHHTRPHWSRVWSPNEMRWLDGSEAVAAILATRPSPAALVPELPAPPPTAVVNKSTSTGGHRHVGRADDHEVARRCLEHIPNNDCHFDVWLAIGMALHSAGCSVNDWIGWSAGSGKHTEGECERRWDSFSANRGRRVTVATLIKMARDYGFEPYPEAKEEADDPAPHGDAEESAPPDTDIVRARVAAALVAARTGEVAAAFQVSADLTLLPAEEREAAIDAFREALGRKLSVRELRKTIASHAPERQKRVIPSDKPKIDVDQPWFRIVQQTARALARSNDPPTRFERTAMPTRIGMDETGRKFILPMTETYLRGEMGREAHFYAVQERRGEVDVPPPVDIARDLCQPRRLNETLEGMGETPVPPLVGLVETPVLRRDGTILCEPGYDPETCLYYRPSGGFRVAPIPDRPTPRQVQAAVAIVDEIIGDFPYQSPVDRANAFGLQLTPVLRATVGPVPLAVVEAPQAGTGKSLFASTVYAIATGMPGAMTSVPEADDEMRKLITSALYEGSTVMLLDNLDGPLFHPALAKALTAEVWKDRKLGVTENITVPQLATWVVTGNNVTLGGDMPRRCYRIRLDAQSSKPWDDGRTFRHDDLIPWVMENRGRIVAALLTICRAWFADGRPPYDVPKLGSFERWSVTVGSILAHAGIAGFLTNRDEMYAQADEDGPQWERFLSTWHERYGDRAVTTATIEEDVPRDQLLRNALPDALSGLVERHQGVLYETNYRIKEAGRFKIRLGKALKQRLGRRFGPDNLHLVRDEDTHNKVAIWSVRSAGSAGNAGSALTQRAARTNVARNGDGRRGAPHRVFTGESGETPPAHPALPADDPYEAEERLAIQTVDE